MWLKFADWFRHMQEAKPQQAPHVVNELAGLPLDYLIGADGTPAARRGRVVEVGYNGGFPGGPAIGYCNLFDENNTGKLGPYLHTSDTALQYGEGQIDPDGDGWARNLSEQFTRRKAQGFEFVELDNPDAYYISAVCGAVEMAGRYGLKVIAKNAVLMDGDTAPYVKLCHGIIVESDCGAPRQYDDLRKRAGNPDMPVWFVYFGNHRADSQATARAVDAGEYRNMGVTYSAAGEYGDSIDVLLPKRGANA